jgi:hypothetical protein
MLAQQPHQRRRAVVLNRALDQPLRQARTIGLAGAAPTEMVKNQLQVIAAGLRPGAIREQLVSLGVDLPGDKPERLIRDRRDVIGNEPQEPQRAQRHRQTEPVLRAALIEYQHPVAIRQRHSAKHARRSSTTIRSGNRSSRLRSASFGYPTP